MAVKLFKTEREGEGSITMNPAPPQEWIPLRKQRLVTVWKYKLLNRVMRKRQVPAGSGRVVPQARPWQKARHAIGLALGHSPQGSKSEAAPLVATYVLLNPSRRGSVLPGRPRRGPGGDRRLSMRWGSFTHLSRTASCTFLMRALLNAVVGEGVRRHVKEEEILFLCCQSALFYQVLANRSRTFLNW